MPVLSRFTLVELLGYQERVFSQGIETTCQAETYSRSS